MSTFLWQLRHMRSRPAPQEGQNLIGFFSSWCVSAPQAPHWISIWIWTFFSAMFPPSSVFAALLFLLAGGDRDRGRGPDARGAGRDHLLRGLRVPDAARGFHAHQGPDGLAHELDVLGGRAAGTEARGGLDEIGARLLGQQAGPHLLFLRE